MINEHLTLSDNAYKNVKSIVREEFNNSELLVTTDCRYSLNDYFTKLNNNVAVVGGVGTGKTRYIVIPNLKQAVGSYVLSDPKGNLYKEYGRLLENMGYTVKLLDFTHPEKSARYNVFDGIRTTQDILKIAEILVDEKASAGTRADPFWDSMTIILISALIGYILETDYQPRTIAGIMSLMREGGRDDEDSKTSKLSKRFDRLKNQNPHSWACQMFDNVNASPTRTYDSIRATMAAKFAKLDTRELRTMLNGSDVDFKQIARQKTAVFVTVSDTDRSMDILANIFFTQAMQALCRYADDECADYRLPVPVRFILDDFATNCRIEEFPRMISSFRSRGISVMLLIQSESQLEEYYGYDSRTIITNCDTYVYLGGNDVGTAISVSKRCNKPLSSVMYMPVGSCWVFRRGSRPVFTRVFECDRSRERG